VVEKHREKHRCLHHLKSINGNGLMSISDKCQDGVSGMSGWCLRYGWPAIKTIWQYWLLFKKTLRLNVRLKCTS